MIRDDVTRSDRYTSCDGRDCVIEWRIDSHLFWIWEIDVDAALDILPEPLDVPEVRPGVALMCVGLVRYQAGHFDRVASPAFFELVAGIHAYPDLSVDMPAPNMTVFALSVYSDSPDFVVNEGETLYTPTILVPSLSAVYSDDGLSVRIRDEHGPIADLSQGHPNPVFAPLELWGQYYTNTRGLQHGIFQWDGVGFVHQRDRKGGTLYPHPFWNDLDVTRAGACYRQMISRPDTLCHERFFEMRSVR